jgi:hypothetical protein
MNDLTEFEPIVDEMLAAVRGDVLLRPTAPLPDGGWLTIDDFRLAEEYVWRRYTDDTDDGMSWSDVRGNEEAELLRPTYADPADRLRAAVRELAGQFWEDLMTRLPPPYRAIVDDVASDLCDIALCRALPEAGSGLFQRMWEVYRLGGWPCGWEGAYPAGRLVVFQPPTNRR